MNVVLLASARRTTPEAALAVREQLGLADRPDVALSLVTVHRPAAGLPGMDALVIGTGARARRRALRVPAAASAAPTAALDPTASVDTDEQAPADPSPATPVVTAPAPAAAPRRGTHRVAHAVRWRARRARRTVAAQPVVQRAGRSTTVRRVRTALSPLGPAGSYAVGALASGPVQTLVAGADVVVALDADTHRAAWLLARRHPGPDVVVGAAAGHQAIAARLDG